MSDTNISRKWEPIDFTIYFRFTWWIAIIAVVVEVALRILGNRLGSGILYDHREITAWVVRAIFFVVIGWRAVKVFGGGTMIGAISGMIAGFMIGFILSLYKFADGFAVWKLFNIFTETVLCIIVGAIVCMIAVAIISKIKNK